MNINDKYRIALNQSRAAKVRRKRQHGVSNKLIIIKNRIIYVK